MSDRRSSLTKRRKSSKQPRVRQWTKYDIVEKELLFPMPDATMDINNAYAANQSILVIKYGVSILNLHIF